jgi:hypothetical protein
MSVPHTRMGMKGASAGVAHRSGGLMAPRKGYGGAPMVERRRSRPRELLLAAAELLGLRKKRGRR